MKTLYGILLFLFILFGFQSPQPKILIIGDSISIGYYPFVKEALKDMAQVEHNPGNAQHTGTGLKKLPDWLGDEKWDIIVFNWGLWDLCYRHADSQVQGNRDKVNGQITFSPDQYGQNLDSLAQMLKNTGSKLLFVSTSYVPSEEAGRVFGDDKIYNEVALQIMKKYAIPIIDLNTPSIKIHKKYGKGNNDVHYTKEGYEKLSHHISKAIKKELK